MYVYVDVQEKIPMEEVFEQLKCSKEGLSSDEGAKRLAIFGPNKLEEKKASLLNFLLSINYCCFYCILLLVKN